MLTATPLRQLNFSGYCADNFGAARSARPEKLAHVPLTTCAPARPMRMRGCMGCADQALSEPRNPACAACPYVIPGEAQVRWRRPATRSFDELQEARRGKGPTVFEQLMEIVRAAGL